MRANGGGGKPEAVKTCLLKIKNILKDVKGKTYILHLTDAPPHEEGRCDGEGVKDFQKVEIKSIMAVADERPNDFYIGKDDVIYFSEFTFTPAGGYQVFDIETEIKQGLMWI